MAQKVDCPCGATLRGETDDELVMNVEQHVQENHPDLVGTMNRAQILGMAQAEEPFASGGRSRGGSRSDIRAAR
jgi:predicted small metal-binding protein